MTAIRPTEPRSAQEFAAAPLVTRMYWGTEPTKELHALVASIYGLDPRPTTSLRIPHAATVRLIQNNAFIEAEACAPAASRPQRVILGMTQDILTLLKSLLAAVNATPQETADFIYLHLAPWLKLSTMDPIIASVWRSTNAPDSLASARRH